METEAAPVRELSLGMRGLLVAASVLVFLAGFQLFILTEQTEHYFAWTIQPPLTAAFLGAGYWSSFLLEFLASRERIWARARVAVPAEQADSYRQGWIDFYWKPLKGYFQQMIH